MSDLPDQLILDNGCPKCNSVNVVPVKFTWWGGVLGPRIMHHTKCKECRYTYNRKTRQSNTKNIILYSIVVFVIVLVLFYFMNRR